jgi:hypothetical protein
LSVARIATFVVVVALHVALYLVFSLRPRTMVETGEHREAPVLYLMPEVPNMLEPPLPPVSARAPSSARSKSALPKHPSEPLAPEPSATEPQSGAVPGLPPNEAPAAIDWSRESELAATREVNSLVDAERRASALSSRYKTLPGPRARNPEFGWDYVSTRRVTMLPEGGMIININDRCAVVVFIVPFIGCQIGKIEHRGDLFKHMPDPPRMGGWKDPDP